MRALAGRDRADDDWLEWNLGRSRASDPADGAALQTVVLPSRCTQEPSGS